MIWRGEERDVCCRLMRHFQHLAVRFVFQAPKEGLRLMERVNVMSKALTRWSFTVYSRPMLFAVCRVLLTMDALRFEDLEDASASVREGAPR